MLVAFYLSVLVRKQASEPNGQAKPYERAAVDRTRDLARYPSALDVVGGRVLFSVFFRPFGRLLKKTSFVFINKQSNTNGIEARARRLLRLLFLQPLRVLLEEGGRPFAACSIHYGAA